MAFIPSLRLSQMLYEEQIQPILAEAFPNLRYAAASLGMCSEILGLDDEISMDHEWGPRVNLFLSEADQAHYSEKITHTLKKRLPAKFKGFDMMWRKPGVDVHDTRDTILYHVYIGTVASTLDFYGGIKSLPLGELEWLLVSEQHLLEFTSGKVYQDDSGELTKAREALRYYPDNVLRFLLMGEWNAVGGDWFPLGRIGSRGDALGQRIQTAKITQRLMRIAFMVSRRYFHYKKWFGTLFKQLPLAARLEPILLEMLAERDWQKVEEKIGEAAALLLEQQNQLGIAPPIQLKADKVDDGRHHIQYDFWLVSNRIAKSLQPPLKPLMENQVFWLHERSLILWNEEVGKWALLLQN